jgi:predicted CopG family antitoxin
MNISKRAGVLIDLDVYEKMKPYLKAEDRTFSSWLRQAMSRYVLAREAIESGKTQININALKGERK